MLRWQKDAQIGVIRAATDVKPRSASGWLDCSCLAVRASLRCCAAYACMTHLRMEALWLTFSAALTRCAARLSSFLPIMSDGFRAAADDVVPDGAKSFVKALQRSLRAGGARKDGKGGRGELASLYDEQFHKLTERYFKASSWPAAEQMAPFVEDGQQRTQRHRV